MAAGCPLDCPFNRARLVVLGFFQFIRKFEKQGILHVLKIYFLSHKKVFE
jgi:hypothetical protein